MILRDEQKIKDRIWALEIRDVWVMGNSDANQQDRRCTWREQNRPELKISAATGAGQTKMSFLRMAHASAVGIINSQPGQKFLCTQVAIRRVNDIW